LDISDRTVGPSNDVVLGFASNYLEVVDSDELPYDSEIQLLVSVLNVLSANAHQLQLELCTSIKSYLAVDSFLEGVVGVLFNSVPFYHGRVDLVDDFKEDLAISALLV